MQLTGAQILIETLISEGVTTVFGYPGGFVLNIYDELYKNSSRINHVITAHEQGATHAADGYARITGKAGVVIATSGPGATNLVTGIANAYLDSVPLVAITGNVPVPLIGRDSFQEVDIVGITQPVVKHNFVVRDIAKLESTLREAFLIAVSGRPGPVLIDVPKSVQVATYEYKNQPAKLTSFHPPHHNDFASAIAEIKKAKRPYIYAGGGVIAGNAAAELLALSERLSAPIGLSMMGLSAVPATYPLNLGMCGMHGKYAASKARAECDLLLAIGVRFSDRATGNIGEYTKKCAVIHFDIDQAEFGKNILARIDLCGEIKTMIAQLLAEIPAQKNPQWLQEIEEFKSFDQPTLDENFSPKNIIEHLNAHCDHDTIIATDVGQHQMWTMQYYRFMKPRTLLTSGGLGTMGFGLGAAIGGCLAAGKKRTVLITGDGSFGMNLNELVTAVSQKLPIVIVLFNNGVLGMVRQWQTMFYDKRYSSTTLARATNFPKLADAFGMSGYTASNLTELDKILSAHFNSLTPILIECKIDPDERVLPMIPPGGSISDIVLRN